MAYSTQSVYSGEVQWHMRSPHNARYRPFGAFAGCKPVALPRRLTKEEQEYYDEQERMDKELWDFMALRGAPRPKEDTPDASSEASPAEKPPQDSRLVLLYRATAARYLSTRDRLRARYARAALALDRRLYWAGRWYREESIFPELFYVLRYVLKAVVAVALVALLVSAWWQGRGGAKEGSPGGMFVYEHVPQYRVRSVTKPRCDCDAGYGKEGN